jgi:phosphohistidine phosphatase
MNTLYLLRHADAAPAARDEEDHDRALTDAGRADARRLGQLLGATDQLPDQFICSTAVRARQTAEGLTEGGHWPVEVPLRSSHALYQAEPADVLAEIQAADDTLGALLLVGHEPAWSATVSGLLGSAHVSLPPGTCVRIDTDRAWADVVFGSGVLRWMIPPSVLR